MVDWAQTPTNCLTKILFIFFFFKWYRGWVWVDIPVGLQLLLGISAAFEEDSTSGLFIQVFDDSDKVGLVFLHGVAHTAARQTLSKAFLKYVETWKRSCWCWRHFSQRILRLKINLLCGAEACPFFSDDLLRLWVQSVKYDLQHYFAWVAHETGRSVDLVLLKGAFLGKCDD